MSPFPLRQPGRYRTVSSARHAQAAGATNRYPLAAQRMQHTNWRHHMTEAFLCDAIRTPIGRYGGALSSVRADDLGALPLKALMERNKDVDWAAIDDVIYGCANQGGEGKRNVARLSPLLARLSPG